MLNVNILNLTENVLVKAEIVKAVESQMHEVESNWKFNWTKLMMVKNSDIYVLKLETIPSSIQGILSLKNHDGMLIMDLLEVAPENYGTKNKRYDYVAGCLIAFACRESFKLETAYKGFLTFNSKTQLVDLYKKKYRAKQIVGQRMYIGPENGLILIGEYLNRKK